MVVVEGLFDLYSEKERLKVVFIERLRFGFLSVVFSSR